MEHISVQNVICIKDGEIEMMKYTNRAISIIICLCLLASLTACGPSPIPKGGDQLLTRVATVTAKALEAPDYGQREPGVSAAAAGANDFAFRLSAGLVKNAGDGNFVCSPYSVWLPLAALVNATDANNQWASENTGGLITDMVQEFDPMTVAAIANAIYFSDCWQWEFDPGQTKEDVFHAPAGDTTAFYMLREGNSQTYYEDDKIQAMPLRFKTGGGLYIILPKNGDAAGLLSCMTNDFFNEIQTDSVQATGKLLLPRFSVDNEVKGLKETLEMLGVPLFDRDLVPLTGGLVEGDTPVWLSDAIQKAVIHVDENGTTAAAMTIMPAPDAWMPQPTEPFEMNCNRPFAFILFDRTYDGGAQVLFTGVVNQP